MSEAMPSPDTEPRAGRGAPPGPGREERAHRILDAAAELILRWGYDKTTIDDIARAAGVAKGTIYLHWKSREALFAALLRRDRVAMLEQVRAGLAADADGATPRSLFRHLALAVMTRPLMKASLLSDAEVLGKLIRNKPTVQTTAAMRSLSEVYLGALREHGAVRTDLSAVEQVNVITGTMYGFFMITPRMPEDHRLSGEHLAELLADTLHRALDAGRPLTPDQTAEATGAALAFLDEALRVARERLGLSLTTTDLGEDYRQ
ncbi:helix-turn-helix domain-containing protein [Sphaerisporangium sp. NPDC005289]|uniref:TetR/AcrR family transcriptional regulator n=1 Tax=Sphaerisporangium sp. NPDC005289 TaxID=3155247 RepID=UPI0033BF99C2